MTEVEVRSERRPDLDGLRGLAIALVLLDHVSHDAVGYGMIGIGMAGVTVFFVLSGYLITSLLMREERVDLRNFYLRRVVRLAPALVVMLAFVAVVGIVRGTDWIPGVATALLYVSNIAQTAHMNAGLTIHAWSLSVEEQFYLLWPLALMFVGRRWLLPLAVIGALAGSLTYGPDDYFSSLTNGAAIMAGCAVALSGLTVPRFGGLVGLAVILVAAPLWLQGAVIAGAVLVIAGRPTALVPAGVIGRRAYSLYLWNQPLIVLLGPLGVVPAIGVAELSYRFVERPVLARFHARLAPRRTRLTLEAVIEPQLVMPAMAWIGQVRPAPEDGPPIR